MMASPQAAMLPLSGKVLVHCPVRGLTTLTVSAALVPAAAAAAGFVSAACAQAVDTASPSARAAKGILFMGLLMVM